MQLEPLHLFADDDGDNRRPDIQIQNPFDEGRQIILGVAVAVVDGQSRGSCVDVAAPFNSRFIDKLRKYEQVASRNSYNCKFVPVVFSHTGQIHHGIMLLIRQQIDCKLQWQNQRQHRSTLS